MMRNQRSYRPAVIVILLSPVIGPVYTFGPVPRIKLAPTSVRERMKYIELNRDALFAHATDLH